MATKRKGATLMTYYVSPTGSTSGNGTAAAPWPSLAFAFPRVPPGSTILCMDGIYAGGVVVPLANAGTAGAPTVIKAVNKWKATFIGGSIHGLTTDDNCHYVTFDGFEVIGALRDGIKLNGNYGVARNCWVHNNGAMGISSHGKTGTVIERNCVEFNGTHPTYHHGVYVDGTSLRVSANIVRRNAGVGLHLWSGLSNSLVCNNFVERNGGEGVVVGVPSAGLPNTIVNNTVMYHGLALKIYNPKGDVIRNNVLHTYNNTDPQAAIYVINGTVAADYNDCWPTPCINDGPHGLCIDPKLIGGRLGWLQAGSPLIGAGVAQTAYTQDFWGRDCTAVTPWVGCFPYSAYLTTPSAVATWYDGKPYAYSPEAGCSLPDLWAVPLD